MRTSPSQRYAEELGCLPAVPWPTFMDGVQANTYFISHCSLCIIHTGEDSNVDDDEQGFSCIIHTGCFGGGEVVACAAKYAHDYPFGPDR